VRYGIIVAALTIVLAIAVTAGAREWIALAESGPGEAAARVLSSDASGFTMEVEVPGVLVESAPGAFSRQSTLAIPGATTIQKPGFPDLPVLSYLVAIPDDGGVELDVSVSGERSLSGYDVVPAAPFARVGEDE
jgi:hypothetical protein